MICDPLTLDRIFGALFLQRFIWIWGKNFPTFSMEFLPSPSFILLGREMKTIRLSLNNSVCFCGTFLLSNIEIFWAFTFLTINKEKGLYLLLATRWRISPLTSKLWTENLILIIPFSLSLFLSVQGRRWGVDLRQERLHPPHGEIISFRIYLFTFD